MQSLLEIQMLGSIFKAFPLTAIYALAVMQRRRMRSTPQIVGLSDTAVNMCHKY